MTSTNDKQHRHDAKPTKHATIMRGVVAPIFGLLAVLFIVLGVLNLTVWKPAREISATTSVSGTRYVVTDAGMLNLLGKSVDIKVSTQGNQPKVSSKSDNGENAKSAAQTCVALGNAKDATGWLADQDYTRVSGLDGWRALSTKTATGAKSSATQVGSDEVAFKDSDMWTNVKCGDSAISLNLNDVKNDQVMIVDMGAAASKSSSAKQSARPGVSITMHWVRDQVPNHALPFFIAAGVCVVLTVLSASIFAIMANESFKRKRAKRRELREKAKAEEVSISEAMTGSIAVLKTSLTHSSHNHRPSHKIRTSDITGAGASAADGGNTGVIPGGATSPADTSATGVLPGVDGAAPSIIDPTRRNLVADMQMQNDIGKNAGNVDDDAATSSAAHDNSARNRLAQDTVSDSGHQVVDELKENRTGETEAAQPQSSVEPSTVVDEDSEHGSDSADAVKADEPSRGANGFGRHRGKPEQESESDAVAPTVSVGRHCRHAAPKNSNEHIPDNRENADGRDSGRKDASGQKQGADYRSANVSVSLEHGEGSTKSGNAERTDTNSEVRKTSSADELIDRGHEQAETTVISQSDLRAYFARLSSETAVGTETSDGNTKDEAGNSQSASGMSGETSNAHGNGKTA